MTLPSSETVIEAALLANTYRELQAICIGYKDNDTELFDYYNSFLEWFDLKYEFLRAEALIMIELQNEIWDLDRTKREERMAEYEKTTPVEVEFTEQSKATEYKQPFERVLDFKIFGFRIYFFLEIAKV